MVHHWRHTVFLSADKNNWIPGTKIHDSMHLFPGDRVLLSGMRRDKSGVCVISWSLHPLFFVSSVCTVCSSRWRMVSGEPDHREGVGTQNKNRHALSRLLSLDWTGCGFGTISRQTDTSYDIKNGFPGVIGLIKVP